MDLVKFQKRLGTPLGIPLSKSFNAEDFAGMIGGIDRKGADTVDHTQQLEAHPRTMNTRADRYRNSIADNAPMVSRLPKELDGVSPKLSFHIPIADQMPKGDSVIVKPYHESIDPRASYWQKHLTQGWAEMTNQNLWHAADMGHMHQRVHIAEHNMGPGYEKEPVVVIHTHPEAKEIGEMHPADYDEQMHEDGARIAAMDFLTNNIDRHAGNLMYLPANATNDDGTPVKSRLIGIDHGRSLQYQASHKGIPETYDDSFMGEVHVPDEYRDAENAKGKKEDTVLKYLDSYGMMALDDAGKNRMPSIASPDGFIPHIAEWWPEVRHKVMASMTDSLNAIRDPKLREHIMKNFQIRAEKLDDIAARPDFYEYADQDDFKIPIHPMS